MSRCRSPFLHRLITLPVFYYTIIPSHHWLKQFNWFSYPHLNHKTLNYVAVVGGVLNLCLTTAKLIKAFLSFKSFTLRGALLLTGSMPWVSLAFDLVLKPVPPNVTHPNSIFYEST